MRDQQEQSSVKRHSQYDTVSKAIIHQNPQDWTEFALGRRDVEAIRVLETEQPTVKSNRADSFIEVRVGGEPAIVHLEIQTRDSGAVPMPYRMAGYIGRGIEQFQLPIYSRVIYLYPRAGRRDPGAYVQSFPGYEVRIGYKVIRLYDTDGSRFLDSGVKGLIPFTPLMRPSGDASGVAWLRRCVSVAESVYAESVSKSEYLTDLGILSGLIFEYSSIREAIMEAIMQESSVIQHFLQQGIERGLEQGIERGREEGLEQGIERGREEGLEQGIERGREEGLEQGIERGARDSLIEGILETLELRFSGSTLSQVASALGRVQSLPRLKALRREALQTASLGAFQEALERIRDSNGNASA